MGNDLIRAGQLLPFDPRSFGELLAEQTALRGLTEAVVYDASSGQVVASAGMFAGLGVEPPPPWAVDQVRQGEVVVLNAGDATLNSVSCSTAGNCSAGGSYYDAGVQAYVVSALTASRSLINFVTPTRLSAWSSARHRAWR